MTLEFDLIVALSTAIGAAASFTVSLTEARGRAIERDTLKTVIEVLANRKDSAK